MTSIWLTDVDGMANQATQWAGRRILTSYALPGVRPLPQPSAAPEVPVDSAPDVQFAGNAWLAGAERTLVCTTGAQAYQLEIDGIGTFNVHAETGQTRARPATSDRGLIGQILLGPCLPLLLAAQGAFQLHGSAVLDASGDAVLLLGSSGAGKSTLAAAVSEPWLRIADDIVTVEHEREGLFIPGPCPQLKLPQPLVPHPACRIRRIVVLHPRAQRLNVRRLSAVEATLALSRHTVAARLFTSDLLQRHLDFCARAAGTVEVMEATYPHEPGMIQPLLHETLA